jgi:hypothetical protein
MSAVAGAGEKPAVSFVDMKKAVFQGEAQKVLTYVQSFTRFHQFEDFFFPDNAKPLLVQFLSCAHDKGSVNYKNMFHVLFMGSRVALGVYSDEIMQEKSLSKEDARKTKEFNGAMEKFKKAYVAAKLIVASKNLEESVPEGFEPTDQLPIPWGDEAKGLMRKLNEWFPVYAVRATSALPVGDPTQDEKEPAPAEA